MAFSAGQLKFYSVFTQYHSAFPGWTVQARAYGAIVHGRIWVARRIGQADVFEIKTDVIGAGGAFTV
jgi:hypothetical protein